MARAAPAPAAAAAASPRDGRFLLGAAALIAAAVFATGHGGLDNGFLNFDDPDMVAGNPRLRRPDIVDLVEVFGEVRDHAYLPLSTVALMIDSAIGGGAPWAYHLGALAWHALNGFLVLLLARRLAGGGRFVPLAAALLFVAHPVAVESVAWASGRKDQVSLALLLAGLLAWCRWVGAPSRGRLALAAGLMFLSSFAKGTTVVFPLLALAVLVLIRGTGRAAEGLRPARALALLFVLAASAAAVHLEIARREETAGAGATHGAAEGAALFTQALGRYALHLAMPVRLSIHYPPGPADAPSAAGLGVLVILLAGPALLLRMRFRAAGFALSWLLASLLPFNNVFPRTSVFAADRYLAVGLPAFALLLAGILASLPKGRWIALAAAALALGWLTHVRTAEFRDGETVFRSAMRVEPDDPLPPHMVAEALLERAAKDPRASAAREEALRLFGAAVGLAEGQGDALRTLRSRIRYADTLLRLGRFEPAREQFDLVRAEVERDPSRYRRLGVDPVTIDHNRAAALVGAGRVLDARSILERILDADPAHPAAALTLAQLNLRDGFEALRTGGSGEIQDRARHLVNRALTGLRELARPERREGMDAGVAVRARAELGRALILATWVPNHLGEAHARMSDLVVHWPDRPEGFVLRADLEEEAGETAAAFGSLTRAFERDPSDSGILLRLARHLRAAGENRKAVELLRKALAADPGAVALKSELAALYAAQADSHRNRGDLDAALLAAVEARELDPANPAVHVAEGETLEARQKWEEAGACYRRALAIDPAREDARRGLARWHQARGLAALAELRARVARAPEAERAAVERNLKDLAMADFRQALDLAAGSSEVALARQHVREAERGEKREAAEALRLKAEAELSAGHAAEAVELLRQAVRVDGTHLDAHYLLARALVALKDHDGAIKSLEDVIALDPEHFPALVAAANLYYVKGRFADVRRAGGRALRLAKDADVRAAFSAEVESVERILGLAEGR